MAKKKKLSKKTIIISVLLLIAVVIATTMVAVFLKDRGSAEATDLDISEMQEQEAQNQEQDVIDSEINDGETPIINNESEDSNNQTIANVDGDQETTDDDTTTQTGTTTDESTSNAGETTTTGAGTTTQRDDVNTIGTTTIQRVETEEINVPYQKTWEDEKLEWSPTDLESLTVASARLDTEIPNVEVIKEAITESGNTLVSAGEKITYKINVKNNSNKKLENIEVTDVIPENTTIDENTISNGGKVDGNKVVWNISIEANSNIELSFDVTVNQEVSSFEEVTIKNKAVANGEESNEVANSILETKKTSTIFRNGVQLQDTETEKVTVKKGDIIKYVISVENKGEEEGTTKVSDEIADNLELTKNNKYTKTQLKEGVDVTVAAGQTEYVEIEVKVKEINGTIKNIATVGKENPSDERETENITGTKINTTTTGFVKVGDILTYEFRLTNSGSKLGKTEVIDTLDLNKVEYVSAEIVDQKEGETVNYTAPKVKWSNIEVAPGGERTVKVTVKVKAEATGELSNGGDVGGTTVIPAKNPIVTFEKTSVVTPDLGKENNIALVKEGSKITYTIKVKNTGEAEAKDIVVTDTVDTLKVTIDESSITESGKIENGTITWNIDTLEKAEEKLLSFTVTVNKQENGSITNTAEVNGTPTNTDTKQYYNPELTSSKTSKIYRNGKQVPDTENEKAVVKVGDIIQYTITVTNSGKVPGTVKVYDTVTQAGVEFVNPENGVTVGAEKYSKAQLEAGIDVEVLAEGSKEVVFEVEVKDINGKITNTANVPGTTPENPSDERDTVNIKGVKEVDKETVKEQEELTYTIKLHNYGSSNGTAIVKDSAPEGTTFKTGSIMIGENDHPEYTEADLIKGITIPVEAGKDAQLSFVVTVDTLEGNAVTGTIKNTALVDEKPTTPETITTVEKVYVTVTVNKTWEDNDIQAQRRPDKIKFEVYKNSEKEAIATYEMNVKDGESTYTFNNLPKYNLDGTNVKYTVAEKEVTVGDLKFYTQDSSDTTDALGNKIYNITNKFTKPEDTDTITVQKIWDDNNNLAGKRPDEVVFKLNGTEEIHLTEDDAESDGSKWSVELDKPVYDENGQEIVYTVTEEVVPEFYTKSENGMTVTNKFVAPTSEKTTITLKKVWEDNNNAAGKRPNKIEVTLKATNASEISDIQVELSGDETANEWTKEIEVQKYNSKADIINYIIEENETGSIFYVEVEGTADLTVTNKFEVPNTTVPVDVTKIWEDQGDTAGKRPDKVVLKVQGSNGVETEVTLDKVNDKTQLDKMWKETVNLPKYDQNGNEITYKVVEEVVPEFYTKNENGVTVTNTFVAPTSEKTTITLKKVWNDNGNISGKRPEKINVTLKATNDSGIVDSQLELTGDRTAAEWTKEVEVQKYNSVADIINYVIEENETGSKFYVEVEGEADLTVTNKFEVPDEKAEITVKKVWNDNKTTRPNVVFVVTGSNSSANKEEVTLTPNDATTDGNTWEKAATTLPKYDENGDEITYTIEEKNVPAGYIKEIDQATRTITNSLPSITVVKDVVEVNGEDVRGVSNIGVKLGDVIKYEIKVTNNGTVPLTNVTVTDEIQNNKQIYLNYNQETGELTNKTNTVVTGENFAAGESKTYTVYYKVETDDAQVAAQNLKNVAVAEGTYKDSNGNDNKIDDDDDASVTIKDAPGLSLVKDKEIWRNGVKQPEGTKVQPGDIIKYTITVTNTGNTVLNNVIVTDTMVGREGFTIIDGSFNIGTLERKPNNVVVIHTQYEVQESDMAETEQTITNTAKATSTTINSDPDSETVTTTPYKAEITVEKSSRLIKKSGNTIEGKAEYGDTIKYTITATNVGNADGSIDVTDWVPEGTELKETNNDTNLTQTELNALKTEAGLTKNLEVPANNGKASIYFEVTVISKPGESIVNTATLQDNTKIPDDGQKVEKSVKVKKQSEVPTITNSNVVIVIDRSGSMQSKKVKVSTGEYDRWGNPITVTKTRLEVAQDVVKDFIDTINLPTNGQNGCAVSVVTFNGPNNYNEYDVGTKYTDILEIPGENNTTKTIATTATDATNLKNEVDNIQASNGTVIAGSLTRAKEQIEAMKKLYPKNNNIVIFVGDGDPDGDSADSIRIPEKAEELQSVATVYAIGFGQNVDILKTTVATSEDKYYTTSDDIDLSKVFSQIGSEIAPATPQPTDSIDGKIELVDINPAKDITLRVKTSGATEFTETTHKVEDLINTEEPEKGKIILENNKYYLNLKAFNADDEIEIDYIANN